MQFTKLRLLGFKSFVDPTELVISPGLTGVVGPNGCGKSNLLEALRWVMGENRPTAMRGGGMEDVIFAGASTRPARNYAEVTLHLDNGDRTAPPAFNDNDTIEIVRRITRDAGSAYKANGKEARARDVQMLFADASTGAHSPSLVRQGQIAELINAKPKARRRILEEAAGISGLYQRRHEAELKLNATEGNLARVEDVLEQLAQQLAQLERQARQAARYREIAEAIRQAEGMLLYRRWREAEDERTDAVAALTEATRAAGAAQTEASQAARARADAEEAVPPLREEEAIAGAILQRQLVARDALDDREARARETIEVLEAQITQLRSDTEREQGLNRDAVERIADLEQERDALVTAAKDEGSVLEAAQEAAREAAQALHAEEGELDRLTEDAARLAARHQSAERRRELAETQVARIDSELDKARTSAAEVAEAFAASAEKVTAAATAAEAAQTRAREADDSFETADALRGAAQVAESEARATRSEAEGEASALQAELAALERLIARETGDGPQLIDEVRAMPGYEAALGAALADDLKAPVVGGDGATGWVGLDPYTDVTALPGGAARLADHVTAPPVLARRLAAIGLVSRADGSRMQTELLPGQRLVSREGDLWRWDGYRTSAEDAPSAAAARLAQMNKLEALGAQAADARGKADKAATRHEDTRARLEAAQAAEADARRTRREAEDGLSAATRALGAAESERATLEGRLETLTGGVARREEDLAAAHEERSSAEAAMTELGDLETARATLDARKVTVEAARIDMIGKRALADETRREIETRAKRREAVVREIESWASRLETAGARIAEFETRITDNTTKLTEARRVPEEIVAERQKLATSIDQAEARRKAASDALAAGETALREAVDAERAAERAAGEAREGRARADALAEAAAERALAAAERIREERETTPDALLESLGTDPDRMADAEAIDIELGRLKRQREALGAVNLRAEEDAREVRTERDALEGERADLEAAVTKLRQGIAGLNREGRHRLLAAFEEVNRNFADLFTTLFGGGTANLVMVESEDPLEAGLEIMCQPPGKKLSTLSLLSGGEQTLTALSLIFAVFRANPSPICVLDEVDAPLDDANVTRFCNLLDEMTSRTDTRFLIITHHAVTMARMDRLFGVTMAEQGVSQLVSVDLTRAEELVDA